MVWCNYKQALVELQRGAVPQIIYAFGEEPLIQQELRKRFYDTVLTSETGELNYSVFEGPTLDWPELDSVLRTRPYFAPRRLVVISSAEVLLKGSEKRTLLESALANLPPYTCVMLRAANRPNSRLKLVKHIAEQGWVVDCSPPDTRALVQLVLDHVQQAGKDMSRRTAYELVERVGGSYPEVKAALEKLLLYCLEEQTVTMEAVKLVVQPSLEANVFTYVDALGTRDLQLAWGSLDSMFQSGEPPLLILAMVARQLRLLLSTKLVTAREERINLAQELGVPGFVADKLIRQSRNFTAAELKQLMHDLCDLEGRIKTGQINAEQGLFMFTAAVGR